MGRSEKFRGSHLDVLELLKRSCSPHLEHRVQFCLDEEDPDFAVLTCLDCDEDFTFGSRELVEPVWLEVFSGPLRSH